MAEVTAPSATGKGGGTLTKTPTSGATKKPVHAPVVHGKNAATGTGPKPQVPKSGATGPSNHVPKTGGYEQMQQQQKQDK